MNSNSTRDIFSDWIGQGKQINGQCTRYEKSLTPVPIEFMAQFQMNCFSYSAGRISGGQTVWLLTDFFLKKENKKFLD